jgi:hypothetical protein
MGRFHQACQFLGGDERDILCVTATHDYNFLILCHLLEE